MIPISSLIIIMLFMIVAFYNYLHNNVNKWIFWLIVAIWIMIEQKLNIIIDIFIWIIN